ncbi:MAG: hypothetical protein ABSG51_11455 [Terracidiphilus sp.]|jgi:hypothetical protein
MKTHPYLRAYLAGIFVPTLVLPLILTVFFVIRFVLKVPVPIERAIIFPMAVVPTVFGLWNMFYLGSHERTHLPIGLHGALIPLLGAPLMAFGGSCLGLLAFGSGGITYLQSILVPYGLIVPLFLCGLAGYYLVWKYIVSFLNRVLGIA